MRDVMQAAERKELGAAEGSREAVPSPRCTVKSEKRRSMELRWRSQVPMKREDRQCQQRRRLEPVDR